MTKKTIELEKDTYNTIFEIADREQFPECLDILSRYDNGKISLDQNDVDHLVDVLAFEAERVSLKIPYRCDDHPKYDDDAMGEWQNFCQSALPHAISDLKQNFDIEE